MPLKVGFTPYVNALPFHLAFKKNMTLKDTSFHFAPPTKLNSLLKEGYLDVALMSSVEFLKGDYDFLFPFGIGAQDAIYSVNFYFKIWKPTLTCHTTTESATSVALLKILANNFWNIDLKLIPGIEKNTNPESFLLIGNQALENQSFKNYQTIDLAKSWHQNTGKNFVFAVLAARQTTEEIINFCQKLQEALNWAAMNSQEILHAALKRSNQSETFLRLYFNAHTYELSDSFINGLLHFGKYLTHV